MARALLVLALGACSFRGPLAGDGGVVTGDTPPPIDAVHDGVPDDGRALSCLEKWQQHVVVLGPGVPIGGVNTSATERDPFVSLDETQLYLSRTNPDPDVFVATRTSAASAFGTPAMTTLDTQFNEGKVSLTEDGQFATVSETESSGGPFNIVLYARTDATTFVRQGLVLAAASNGKNNFDPYITPDAKRLYWAPVTINANDQHIELASRPSTAVTFATDRVLTELGSPASDPAVSYDETVILYSMQTDGGSIHYATRATASGPFTPAGLVPTINTIAGNEADPHLSKDACRLYYAQFSTATDWDLFVAPVL